MKITSNAGSQKFAAEQERRASSLDIAKTPHEIERETRLRESEARAAAREEARQAATIAVAATPPRRKPRPWKDNANSVWHRRLVAVAAELKTTPGVITGPARNRLAHQNRQVVWWVMRSSGHISLATMGRWFGRHDSTINYGVTKIAQRRRREPTFLAFTERLLAVSKAVE